TYIVNEGGGIEITPPPPDGGTAFQLEAVLDGNVLVGRQTTDGGGFSGPATGLFLLVRNSSGLTKAKFAGNYRFAQHELQVVDRPLAEEPPKAQGFQYNVGDLLATVAATGVVQLNGTQIETSHDDKGDVFSPPDAAVIALTGHLAPRSDGSFSSTDL